ncbi:MAPEG family protein [Amylibacter sp.]|nr:MAPEG family protein [Amylibacter sp.]MDB9794707.1 MAPEG family protein [bacterium]MDB9875249.1 MAPEG family protein [Amylibacter sp.]
MHYTGWAKRAKLAHSNAVQNLVIFAPLTLLVLALGLSNDMTAHIAVIYFFARAFHYIMHITAIPLTRTICFLVGVACQIVMAATIFNAL